MPVRPGAIRVEHMEYCDSEWKPDAPCSCEPRTYVDTDAVYEMLDLAYHPQRGENHTHPADTFRAWVDARSEERER